MSEPAVQGRLKVHLLGADRVEQREAGVHADAQQVVVLATDEDGKVLASWRGGPSRVRLPASPEQGRFLELATEEGPSSLSAGWAIELDGEQPAADVVRPRRALPGSVEAVDGPAPRRARGRDES